MDELDIRDEVGIRLTPSEELEPIKLDDHPEHLVYIGSRLAKDVRDLFYPLLKTEYRSIRLEARECGRN